MLADVLHFAFTVSDLERSVAWYTEVLGLEVVHRQRQEPGYTRTLVGIPDADINVAMLKVPGLDSRYSTHMLELVHYIAPPGEKVDMSTNNVGNAHLALLVDDIHERYECMLAAGVTFRNPPVEITTGTNAGGFACYLRDPDGITIELLEPSRERQRELGMTAA
jgi:catechol 2,3-dioxygenase-like lactoylglutathione lyase family enzyme